jgi:parallel beta-helix repeat protein
MRYNIRTSYTGIHLLSGSNNSIVGNNITNCVGEGITLESSNNTIYHNNFINNTKQVWTDSTNFWDDDYPSGGNYWSDYSDVDLYWGSHQNETGSDGIGDTPYIIDENNNDNYPLMSPYEYWSYPIPGDINKDMEVDYKDLFQLTTAYCSTPGKPNWNPNCDLKDDDKVDASDLFELSKNYGKETGS